MKYVENYYNLSHGTDETSANKIKVQGFKKSTAKNSWCGDGVYFYDIKRKAWWAAKRKCEEIKKTSGIKHKPTVIFADILNIPLDNIFDMRVHQDLMNFEKCIDEVFGDDYYLSFPQVSDEIERKILLRAMLISFYADAQKFKLVIGTFRQRPQPLYEHAIEFANNLDMIFGIETIYCVKDTNIISNIH